ISYRSNARTRCRGLLLDHRFRLDGSGIADSAGQCPADQGERHYFANRPRFTRRYATAPGTAVETVFANGPLGGTSDARPAVFHDRWNVYHWLNWPDDCPDERR